MLLAKSNFVNLFMFLATALKMSMRRQRFKNTYIDLNVSLLTVFLASSFYFELQSKVSSLKALRQAPYQPEVTNKGTDRGYHLGPGSFRMFPHSILTTTLQGRQCPCCREGNLSVRQSEYVCRSSKERAQVGLRDLVEEPEFLLSSIIVSLNIQSWRIGPEEMLQ